MSRHNTSQQQQQQQRITKSLSPLDGSVLGLRDGDVFYRTVQRYPGLPDVDDEVSLMVTNAAAVERDRKKTVVEWQVASVSLRNNAGRDVSDK